MPKTLEAIDLHLRDGEYHAAWLLSGTLPARPYVSWLRPLLRLNARDISGALADLSALTHRLPAFGEVLARLHRADPAQLNDALTEQQTYLTRMMLTGSLLGAPDTDLKEEAYSLLLDLVMHERRWKEAQCAQALPDDEQDWVLLREMLVSVPSPRNTAWVYSLRDSARFIREVHEATGAPDRPGLAAPIYAKLMYAAVETGDLDTANGLLSQSSWTVAPALQRYLKAVLLGRAALARGEAELVEQTFEAARTITGTVNGTALGLTHQIYPQLLAAAAALHWRLPGREAAARAVLEAAAERPWLLDLLRDYVGDRTTSTHPRWGEDELNVAQELDYLPAFEAACTDPTLPADLRGLCALLVGAAHLAVPYEEQSDELTARSEAAWTTAQRLAPDALWLLYQRSARSTGPVTPAQLRAFAIWGSAALRAGDTPDPMLYQAPGEEVWARDAAAELHRVLIDWPQEDPDVRCAGEIVRLQAWEYGGWPESLEAHDLNPEQYEAARWRLSQDMDDPDLQFQAGLSAHQAGLMGPAQAHYEQVLQTLLARLGSAGQDPVEAHPAERPARLNLALLHLEAADYSSAQMQLDQVLSHDPLNATALRLRQQIPPLEAPGRRAVSRRHARSGAPAAQQAAPGRPDQGAAFLQSASARYPAVQPVARKLLGVLALLERPLTERELGEYSGMDMTWVGRHLGTLLRQGMLTRDGGAYRLNPAIATQARLDADHVTTIRLLHAGSGQAVMPIFRSQRERLVYSSLLHLFPNQLVFPNMALQSIFA